MCTSYRKLAYNNHHSQITHFLSYPQSHPTAPGRRHDRRTKVYWVPNHQQLRSKSSEETRKPGDSCGDSWRFHWLNLKRYLPGIELCWVVWYTKVRSPQSRSWDSVVPPLSMRCIRQAGRSFVAFFFFRSRGESQPKGLDFDTKILERVVDASDTMMPWCHSCWKGGVTRK